MLQLDWLESTYMFCIWMSCHNLQLWPPSDGLADSPNCGLASRLLQYTISCLHVCIESSRSADVLQQAIACTGEYKFITCQVHASSSGIWPAKSESDLGHIRNGVSLLCKVHTPVFWFSRLFSTFPNETTFIRVFLENYLFWDHFGPFLRCAYI